MLKKNSIMKYIACILLFAVSTSFVLSDIEEYGPTKSISELTAILKSDASFPEKYEACRQLSRVGDKTAVPVLASLLSDEKMAHMARYALEPIPDPAVDAALRDALSTVKGKLLVGVIHSIAYRRDSKAVMLLGKLLSNPDPMVAAAAATGLGRIATPEAAEFLVKNLDDLPFETRHTYYDAALVCGTRLADENNKKQAMKILNTLQDKKFPLNIRASAVQCAILADPSNGTDLVKKYLQSDEKAMFHAVLGTVRSIKEKSVTKTLMDAFDKLSPDRQIPVLSTLAERGDPAAMETFMAASGNSNIEVQVAAIQLLPQLGGPSAVPALIKLLSNEKDEVKEASKFALAAMDGTDVDSAITGMLSSPDAGMRNIAVEMVGQRRIVSAMPALLKSATDEDKSVRTASIKVLSSLAGIQELQPMINLLTGTKEPSEMQAIERALSAICTRAASPAKDSVTINKATYGTLDGSIAVDVAEKITKMINNGTLTIDVSNANFGDPASGNVKQMVIEYVVEGTKYVETIGENGTLIIRAEAASPECTDALCAAIKTAPDDAKIALLRVLRSAGGTKALDVVRGFTTDSNKEIQNGAIAVLCDWSSVKALPDVIKLSQTSTDPRLKILAVRGAIKLSLSQAAPPEAQLASLNEISGLIERDDEKRMMLGLLGSVLHPKTLDVIMPYIDNAATKNEACAAIMTIAQNPKVKGNKAMMTALAGPLAKVVEVSDNGKTKNKAKEILSKIGK